MGASVSIANESEVVVNIALKQVGVLYWKNGVEPGETVSWDLGRVWVTVEAIFDDDRDGRTRYRELDRILPIILATGGAVAVAGGAVIAAGPVLLGSGAAAAAASALGLGGATAAAEGAGAAATFAVAEGIAGTGAAGATGAAAGAAAGAFAREVAGIFGRKAVGSAADVAVGATVGEVYRQYRREPAMVKARKYGVFVGSNPKLVIKGNAKALTIDYVKEVSKMD